MKSTTKKIGAVALTLGIAAGGFAAWRSAHHDDRPGAENGSAPAAAVVPANDPLRMRWAAGLETTFSLQWEVDTHVLMANEAGTKPVDTHQSIDADVVVRSLGAMADAYGLAIRVENIRKQEVTFGGQRVDQSPAVADAAKSMLEGQDVFVTMDGRGRVRRVAFRKDAPAPARQALSLLVKAMHVTLAEDASAAWEVDETSAMGAAHARYERGADGALTRSRTKYEKLAALPALDMSRQKLTSTATIVLDADGALASIADREELSVGELSNGAVVRPFASTSQLTLKRVAVRPFDLTQIATGDLEDASDEESGAVATDPRKKDERTAKGMTLESMVASIGAFAAGASAPKGFVVHAGAYLRLHPEQCDDLLTMFEDARATAKGRGLILDVLSSSGDAAAQRAMRVALASPEAKKSSGDYAMFVQRMAFVVRPDRESLEFLAKTYAAARASHDAVAARGAVTALGGAVHRLHDAGRVDEARAYDAKLRSDLAKSSTPDERVALLSALGNAAMPDERDAIRDEAHDRDAAVRDQVAHSLRSFADDESRATLLDLAADGSKTVSLDAVRSLTKMPLSESNWSTLEGLVTNGQTPDASDPALVQLIGMQRAAAGPHADAILRALLARVPSTDGDLRMTIVALLGQSS